MSKSSSENQRITNEGTLHKYFHMMLNMADDDLDPFQYRLLGHYLRWAGHGGEITQSIRQTAKATKISVNKVRNAREELTKMGYLKVFIPTDAEQKQGVATLIVVVDKWAENIARYAQSVSDMPQGGVSNMTQVNPDTCIKSDTGGVSNMTPMNNYTEEPKIKQNTLSAGAVVAPFDAFIDTLPLDEPETPVTPAARPRDLLFDAIADTWKIKAGGMVGQIKAMLLGTAKKGGWAACNFDPPATAEEVTAFAKWYHSENPDLSLPTVPMKIQAWFYRYRDAQPKMRWIIEPADPLPAHPAYQEGGEQITDADVEELNTLVRMVAENVTGGF